MKLPRIFPHACFLLGVMAGFSVLVTSVAAKAPNIVIISSDDAGMNGFGFSSAVNGVATQFETPNLDALAAQGVVLKQGYTASPICTPSRIGLLTGQYNNRFGMEDVLGEFKPNNPTWGLGPEQTTIAERLKDLGYSTGAVGKWHVGQYEGYNRPLDRGFDEFYGILGGQRNYWHEPTFNSYRGMYKGNQYYEDQYRMEGDQSKYDPVMGRYVTDAWGEEAVNFINNHAQEENPFFLYLPFTAPHTPVFASQAKPADLAHFSHISNPLHQQLAALTYAMDRSIGDVLNALEAQGIDDNTIVMFMNDNGPPATDGTGAPFSGHKGSTFEGGIRMPFIIKMPGVAPGVYDEVVTALDILPTFVKAAGGDISQIETDGRDIRPFLAGEATQDPNEVFFWRNWDAWAVRRGDWKLTTRFTRPTPDRPANPPYLVNVATNPLENINYGPQQPGIEAELFAELAHWEATLQKPKWGSLSTDNQNKFDHFAFRVDLASVTNWSGAGAWNKAGTATVATMMSPDAYANAVLEFGVRNDADYTATNDMQRVSRQTYMLNEFRFTGNFTGAANRKGTVDGLPVLMVKSLTGDLPEIMLGATKSGTGAQFTHELKNEIQLLDNLEITGNGTQDFVISGAIRDFYIPTAPPASAAIITVPHNVRKSGSSKVTLAGNNTFGGSLIVDGGQVELNGVSAAINGAASIVVGSAGTFTLQNGNVVVQTIDRSAGGAFNFNGGTLKAVNIIGNLTNNGGIFAPGNSPALTKITGNYDQNSGRLQIELGGTAIGTQYDTLVVTGEAEITDRLEVQLINGFVPTAGRVFQIINAAGGVDGTFSTTTLPALTAGLFWNVMYGSNSVILAVAPTNSLSFIPGDFDLNGVVDGADYTVWRDRLGSASSVGDANFDGQVTTADYTIWKSNFGFSLNGSGSASSLAVPEPGSVSLWLLATCWFYLLQRR